jgi:SAM-dependent methyltransferase
MTWQLSQDYKGKFELIKNVLDKESCKNVLDIGCNAGAITNLFGEAGYFAVGIDQNVDCNGKHSKACIGEHKLSIERIFALPAFDSILLLSALHQIIQENGDEYACNFVIALLHRCQVLIVELAGINSKYGYETGRFKDNDSQSIQDFFKSWLDKLIDCEFIGETNHNAANEPHRYLFKLSQKCL